MLGKCIAAILSLCFSPLYVLNFSPRISIVYSGISVVRRSKKWNMGTDDPIFLVIFAALRVCKLKVEIASVRRSTSRCVSVPMFLC